MIKLVDSPLPPPASKIDVKNLDFFYGRNQALKNVTIAIRANATTAIIGPSGCGKSTLLRTLNRVYDLYPGMRATGEILLDGVNVLGDGHDVSDLRAKVGMVFQSPTPFQLSIFENIAFPLRHYEKLSRADQAERVEKALRQAALWDEVKDKLHSSALGLSGGQQQRLCIARSLAVRPEVLLMDEPTSALDPISTAKIEELLNSLAGEITIVIVTHNLHQAARIGGQIVFMLEGEVIEVGDEMEIFQRPRDPRTANYVTGRFG